ncbi:nesprin-1-like [Gastrophryne carolinensis]
MGKDTISQYLKQIKPKLERFSHFGSLENLSLELQRTKDLCVQAKGLVQKSRDINLGKKSKCHLLEKSNLVQKNVSQVKEALSQKISKIILLKDTWEKFNQDFETHSKWISDKEKELCQLEVTDISPDAQVSCIKEFINELQEKANKIADLEASSQTFDEHISAAEMAQIKTRQTHMAKQWDGLEEHAHRLEKSIMENVVQQEIFDKTFKLVQNTLEKIEASLACPVKGCSSAAETYKLLSSHQDLCHDVESIKASIYSLTVSSRKLANKDKAVKEITALQERTDALCTQAKERYSLLERLLVQCQRQEKELSSFTAWLEKSETLLIPQQELFPAEKSKIEAEKMAVQNLQNELSMQSQNYIVLVQLCASLYPTSSESSIEEMRSRLGNLTERWNNLPETISTKLSALESVLNEHQKFDDMVHELFLYIKQFLMELQETTEINTANHEAALTINKKNILFYKQESTIVFTSLKKQHTSLRDGDYVCLN